MDDATESISDWLRQLKAGEAEAAQKLWDRYSAELMRVARQRLGSFPRGAGDEEDVALSVFRSIFRGAAEGRFDYISNRDELWWLLLSVAKRKTVDHIRRETAQKRHIQRAQVGADDSAGTPAAVQISLSELVSTTPAPDFLVALEEQYLRLLEILRNDQLREIAVLRIEGYTVEEIATRIGIGRRAIERKLQLIRSKWKHEIT
jgi:RNA polymerase sigma factor (sigma-70 family)